MSKRLARRDWLVIIFACVVGVSLAIWFVLSDSPWPVGIALAGVWLASLIYRRDAGVLYWLVFLTATVPVIVWLLGYGGEGLLILFVVLNAIAIAVAKPRTVANGSA